jgi:hypothetical protein
MSGSDQSLKVLTKLGSIGNPAEAAKAALEAATAIWDNYKAKIEEVARAQAEATGKIMASANEAMAAMKALNEALHPLTTTADKDEQDLARRIDQLKTTQAQQKEINQANEAAELAPATNEEQKVAIKDEYRLQNVSVDELTQSQIAGFQSAAAEQAQKQIADIEAKNAARKAQTDAGNARLQAEADYYNDQLKNLDFTHDLSGHGHKDLSDRITGIKGAIKARTDEFTRFQNDAKKNAGELGQFAAKTQGEADESQFKSDTQRATDGSVLWSQRFAEQATKLLDQQTAEQETLRQLLDKTGTSHEQTQNLLQQIIAKHLDLTQTVAQLHAQLDQIKSRQNQPIGQ